MQTIQMPDDQFEKLTTVVQAAGYDDVPAFINALTDEVTVRQQAPMSKEQLAASEAMLRCGEADLAAGRTQDMRDALLALGEKRGYSLDARPKF